MNDAVECDILIVGSGAAGLTAALTASVLDLKVILCEQADLIGGTTALSGGEVWIPMSRQAGENSRDSAEAALEYLESVVGQRLDRERAITYLARAPEALAFLEDHSHVKYELMPEVVDYSSELRGATAGLRSLGVLPFDGRRLGRSFPLLRPPLATSLIFGGMALSRDDVPHFTNCLGSPRSALLVARLLLGHLRDRLLGYPRGTRLVMGNALIGRLLATLIERDVPIWTNTRVSKLTVDQGRISGAELNRDGSELRLNVRNAVVVATGGFSGSERLRNRHFAHVKSGHPHLSPVPATNNGSGIDLVLECGGVLDDRVAQPAAWTPASAVPVSAGQPAFFPHFGDRAKPGVIVVNSAGRRFSNEAINYHEFTQAMLSTADGDASPACFIVTSHRHLRRYGLGRVPPSPGRRRPFLDSGYLVKAETIERLGQKLDIDSEILSTTVKRFDEHARRGEDPDFGKGSTDYQRAAGDVDNQPNPCVAPLGGGPYYAIRMLPGDIGTMLGVAVNARSQALDRHGKPIHGLYAVGTVAVALAAGTYPGAGSNLGPAITSGYVAAQVIMREEPTVPDSGYTEEDD